LVARGEGGRTITRSSTRDPKGGGEQTGVCLVEAIAGNRTQGLGPLVGDRVDEAPQRIEVVSRLTRRPLRLARRAVHDGEDDVPHELCVVHGGALVIWSSSVI
jgi:hypothetical protein